jgi:hypothetical protein
VDFERSRRAVSDAAIAALRATLEAAGVEFTNGKRPGVRLKLWERGDRARLKRTSEKHAATFGIGAEEILEVESWEVLPGDPPWGRLRLRRDSGEITSSIEASHFEMALRGNAGARNAP